MFSYTAASRTNNYTIIQDFINADKNIVPVISPRYVSSHGRVVWMNKKKEALIRSTLLISPSATRIRRTYCSYR